MIKDICKKVILREKDKYDILLEQFRRLTTRVDYLEDRNKYLKNEYAGLKGDYIQLKDDYTQLRMDYVQLQKDNTKLREELENYKTNKNSNNSSIPPSKDENRPLRNKSLRKKTERKPGGQPGHEGNTLRMTDRPDDIENHQPPVCCEHCGADISDIKSEFAGRRQVIDLPPIKPVVTEHHTYKRVCSCGHENHANYPEGIDSPVSYGPRIESLIGYFHARQYIPFKRMQEVFHDIFSLSISEGGLHHLLKRLHNKCLPVYQMICDKVFNSNVIGSDETGAKVNGKKYWFWTWQSLRATFIKASDNRGTATIEDNQNPGMDAVLVHDCWRAQFNTDVTGHQLCTAHLLRELNYLDERYKGKSDWPGKFRKLLKKALILKDQLTPLDYDIPNKARDRLSKKLQKLLIHEVNPSHKEVVSFRKRMVKYQNYIFTFLYHPEVPPDNNGSERAIRNVKVKQKVSGQFKSVGGADIFAVLRSVIDTALKNDQNVLHALQTIAVSTQRTY